MAPTLDVFQQIFVLSTLANQASKHEATPLRLLPTSVDPLEQQLQTAIGVTFQAPVMQAEIGTEWALAWGPAVFRPADALVSDNAAFVAYHPALTFQDGSTFPTYVVGIAATNAISLYDWLGEDAWVCKVADFSDLVEVLKLPAASAAAAFTTPQVSWGTALGLCNVMNLTSVGGQTLLDYLRALNAGLAGGPKTRIVFTGHSLAGALSPTVALYLHDKGYLANFERALVYPTAGPTPGNAGFAAKFRLAFPHWSQEGAAPWQRWNTQIVNKYDVVPHAWSLKTLLEIPGIYGNKLSANPAPWEVYALTATALADAWQGEQAYGYWPITTLASFDPVTIPPVPTTLEQFLTNLAQSHTTAYNDVILGSAAAGVPVPLVLGVFDLSSDKLFADVEQQLHQKFGDQAATASGALEAWCRKTLGGNSTAVYAALADLDVVIGKSSDDLSAAAEAAEAWAKRVMSV
jgi:Lipase (class 3)